MRGFTFIELVVTLGIIAIVSGIAVYTFRGTAQESKLRAATHKVVSLASEARSAALALGSANGTARITGFNNCPPDFSNGGIGTAGFHITSIGGGTQRVTYVRDIDRNVAVNPPTFTITCDTFDLDTAYTDEVSFDTASPSHRIPAGLVANTFFVAFTSRGFLDGAPTTPPLPGAVRFVLISRRMGTARPQRVLILGSGIACLEGTAGSCART